MMEVKRRMIENKQCVEFGHDWRDGKPDWYVDKVEMGTTCDRCNLKAWKVYRLDEGSPYVTTERGDAVPIVEYFSKPKEFGPLDQEIKPKGGEERMVKVELLKCKKCGYEWRPRKHANVIRECPQCKTRSWR
jgi:hypothetical protein